MTKDSTSRDPDEASDIMEDSIPEPFTKFVFLGSVANTQAEKQCMKLIESTLTEVIEPQPNGYHNIWPITDNILVHNDGGVYHVVEKKDNNNKYIFNTENLEELNSYLSTNYGETIVDPEPKEKPVEEPKKRYPLHMWKTIEDAVAGMTNIPDEHKEAFISLVGDRATTKRVPRVGWKSSLLPAKLRAKYGERANYNHLILSPEYFDTTLEQALTDIYDTMKTKWFNESLSEGIEIENIADYIVDHYDFDDIDDKYSCINSIKDSFKDEKTISKEELEQFIGAHNGKDKIEENLTEGINDLRNEKGQVMADKWYARMYPDDKVGIEQLDGITLDDALKDRSILGHCDTQVRERVYAQLDKYIPLSKESPMYKAVNEDYSDLNKGEWVEYNLSVRKGTENIIPVKVDVDLGNEFYGWAWGEGYHKYQKSRIVDKIDMDDTDEIIRKYSLNEASYGGAFDIEDDQYFTRDDIEDAAEYVIDHINETFDDKFVLGGTWFENNTWTVNVQTEDGMEEYEKSIHIDMRKIKAPRDLKDKFNLDMAAKLIKDIKELKYDIHEDFEDDITETFIADGEEYEWIDKRITRHDTKDSQGFAEEWFIASAKSLEDGETYYFIIDDSDFIDWGPCYTLDEAQEFLISKDSDYDDMDESLKESVTSDAEPIENGPKVGMASIISDLIKDEYEAIDGYNAAIATAEAEGFEDAIKVLTEIQAEENIHIGQLQEVMKLFDPNADKVEDGQAEGAEQLANPIATDIDEELETEDSVFNKFVEIEKDLNDGEAVTAVIDKMVADNKDNPTYEKAYQRWLNK